MALNTTQLAAALRLGDGVNAPAEPLASILTRLLGVASATADLLAPTAPEAIRDEAAIRMAAYLYEAPDAQRGSGYASSWNNSGAAGLVAPWRVRRAGTDVAATPAAAPGGAGNPVTALTVDGNELTVTLQDGTEFTATLPATEPYVLPAATTSERGGVTSITNAIIDEGSSQRVYGWMISHVKRVAAAAVAAEVAARNNAISAAIASEAAARSNAIDAATVPPATLARIPNPALPAPSNATRGHFLAQASDGERYAFSASTGVDDETARTAAADAAAAAVAAGKDALQALGDADRNLLLIARLQEQAVALHAAPGTPARVTALANASMFVAAAPTLDAPGAASISRASWNSAHRIWIRLADGQLRSDYVMRFHGDGDVGFEPYDVPGGQWQAATQFAHAGYTFWEAWPGAIGGDVTSVELLTTNSSSLYTGELADASLAPAFKAIGAWRYVEPQSGRPSLTGGETNTTVANDRQSRVPDDLDLTARIVDANAYGARRPLQISASLEWFYRKNTSNTALSGSIRSAKLSIARKRGNALHNLAELAAIAPTLADFNTANSAHGFGNFGSSPDRTTAVDASLDTGDWDLQDGDELHLRLELSAINGFAEIKLDIEDLAMVLTDAFYTPPAPAAPAGGLTLTPLTAELSLNAERTNFRPSDAEEQALWDALTGSQFHSLLVRLQVLTDRTSVTPGRVDRDVVTAFLPLRVGGPYVSPSRYRFRFPYDSASSDARADLSIQARSGSVTAIVIAAVGSQFDENSTCRIFGVS